MPKSNKNLQNKIFSIMLFFTLLISLYFLVSGLIMEIAIILNVMWIITSIIIGILTILNHIHSGSLRIRKTAFLILIFFIIPFGWLSSAANASFNMGYIFLSLMSIYYFYTGKERIFLVSSTILIATSLMTYQVIMPEHFVIYTNTQLIINTLIQVPLIFIVGVYMLAKYTDTLRTSNQLLETLSTHDDMTGIYNRRYIYSKLAIIQENCTNTSPVTIGFIDIDYFKDINDTYGHDIGDKVITAIASHIKEVIGSYGIVGRYGGDEFIVILEDCSPSYIENIIHDISILDKINTKFLLEKPVTVSGGFTTYDGSQTIEECLVLVDDSLYKAKKNGRNQIIID